jgi:hypothetical protein
MFFYYCIINKEFRKRKISDFRYEKLSSKEVEKIMKQSKCIVDAQYPKNTGLTMRTFETLGTRKKLITTNKDISNYDFYNKNNIMIVDRFNPIINKIFFETDYEDVDKFVYDEYYIDNWMLNLLG